MTCAARVRARAKQTVGRAPAALRRHRRSGDERPRARRARAGRRCHGLGPLARRRHTCEGSTSRWPRGTMPPTSRTAPRSSSRARSRPTTRSGASRRRSSTGPTCSGRSPGCARRSQSPARTGRPRRRAWSSTLCGPAGSIPAIWSAARCARPGRTPAGGRGSGWSSRPTSPTARCSSSSRALPCSPTPSSTTTRRTRPSATWTRRSAPSWRWPSRSSSATSPISRASPGCRRAPSTSSSSPAARASPTTACRSTLTIPGAHNARNAATALAAAALAGAPPHEAAAALAGFSGAGRRFERVGRDAGRRRGRRRLRAPPDRGPGDDRGRPHARTRAASWPSSSRTCSHAPPTSTASSAPRSRSPTSSSCSTSTRRASAPRTSRASPAGWSRRRPPTRPTAAASPGCPGSTTPSAFLRAELREGDLLLTLGAGNVDAARAAGWRAGLTPSRHPGRGRVAGVRPHTSKPPPRCPRTVLPARLRRRSAACRRPRWRLAVAARLRAGEVTTVTVTGSTTSEESAIRAALDSAAREMTTLHVAQDVLQRRRRAVHVGRRPARARRTSRTSSRSRCSSAGRSPPSTSTGAGSRSPASGIVLTGRAGRSRPAVDPPERTPPDGDGRRPAHTRRARGRRRGARSELLDRSERLCWGSRGLTLDLRDGPPLYFGTGDDSISSGRARLACWPSRAPPGRPISTSACPAAWPPEASARCPRSRRSGGSSTLG